MTMKKIILSGLIVTFLASCGGSGNGELIGVQKRKNMESYRSLWNGFYSSRKL